MGISHRQVHFTALNVKPALRRVRDKTDGNHIAPGFHQFARNLISARTGVKERRLPTNAPDLLAVEINHVVLFGQIAKL